MLRVGRFVDGKTRPIVVNLRAAWDRRIILAECGKLKHFEERVFSAPDESTEERHKKRLTVLKLGLNRMSTSPQLSMGCCQSMARQCFH
jgi:hypothetical protein